MTKIFDDHSGGIPRYQWCAGCKELIDFHHERATSFDLGKTWYHTKPCAEHAPEKPPDDSRGELQ